MDIVVREECHHRPAFRIFLNARQPFLLTDATLLLEIMNYLPWHPHHFAKITSFGDLTAFKYIEANDCNTICNVNMMLAIAASFKHIKCFRYIYNKFYKHNQRFTLWYCQPIRTSSITRIPNTNIIWSFESEMIKKLKKFNYYTYDGIDKKHNGVYDLYYILSKNGLLEELMFVVERNYHYTYDFQCCIDAAKREGHTHVSEYLSSIV